MGKNSFFFSKRKIIKFLFFCIILILRDISCFSPSNFVYETNKFISKVTHFFNCSMSFYTHHCLHSISKGDGCNWKYGFTLGGKLMIRFKKFLISAWISIDIRTAEWFLSYPIGLQIAESQVLLDFLMVASLIIGKTLLNRMSLLTCHALLVERLYLPLSLSQSRSQFNNFDYFSIAIQQTAEYSSYEYMCIFSVLSFFHSRLCQRRFFRQIFPTDVKRCND